MNNRSVDVIIPTYNGLPFLEDTIKSVLAQSHHNLTLYVIDDGSTDNGATKKYVTSIKDKRVQYVHKANGGQATARNYGIKISSAPFVTFLDSDDIWHVNKLKKQLELMDRNSKVGMVYGLCKLIDANNNIFDEVVWKKSGKLFDYLLGGNKISGSASMVMIRREVFDSVGIFHEDFLIGEDWEMWLRIAKSYEIDYVPEFIAQLRVLDNGMQKNYPKMAKGLDYMLPIMVKDFRLGFLRRAKLGKTCLKEACFLYYNGGEKAAARRVFIKALSYNPLTFFTLNYHVWFLYLRILLGNDLLRKARRRLSTQYRTREMDTLAEQSKTIKDPLISVVLPVYNGELYIKDAVDSILAQTFKDFELIIIDDGSTDKTNALLKEYTDPRIVVINQKRNRGLVKSLNVGLDQARGQFIARQDADDISEPLRLQHQVEIMHKHHDLVTVGTNATTIGASGKKTGVMNCPEDDSVLRVLMLSQNPFIHGSVMFRSRLLAKIGGYNPATWPAEDYDMWRRLLRFGRAINLQENLYRYRTNESGITQTNLGPQTQKVIELKKTTFKQARYLLRSPLTLRRALLQAPGNKQLLDNVKLLAKVSLFKLRPATFILACLNLILAVRVKHG